ncbi:hypothetical protein QAD02_020945 [Eretmocerus hayati]|uniref:Uncharacterized protein n=1 Tax=Eretmocerus hayati TaxID=131215 RepID=A0ACC2PS19_9HYME|nr:hypothetical protein QAD02_020945 [Eretmocerus hayati]
MVTEHRTLPTPRSSRGKEVPETHSHPHYNVKTQSLLYILSKEGDAEDDVPVQHAISYSDHSGDDERSETAEHSEEASHIATQTTQTEASRAVSKPVIFESQKTDDTVMFPQSGITVHEVGANLRAISLRHHFTYEATTEIANFFKFLSGDTFNYEFLFNKYYMQKHYNCDKSSIFKYHSYCRKCEKEILHETSSDAMSPLRVVCRGCSHEQDVSSKNLNYSISIDLKHQFSHMLQSPRIRNKIIEASNIAKQKARSDDAPMSTNGNTDGAPVAENSVLSMWRATVRVNELSTPESASHTIVCGMTVVDHEPSSDLLNLYLDVVLVDNIEPSSVDGLVIEEGGDKSEILVFATEMNLDSKARPAVQKREQYNARHGCSWCYAEGVSIGGCISFPSSHTFASIRTKTSHERDVKEALETRKVCNGVLGPCSVMKLLYFDPVWGCTFDDLHGGYLGMTKQH